MFNAPLLSPDQCAAIVASVASARVVRANDCKASARLLELDASTLTLVQGALDRAAEHYRLRPNGALWVNKLWRSAFDMALVPRVTTYDAPDGFAGWHIDVPASTPARPSAQHWLAVSVQLSAGSDYEGGHLIVANEGGGRPREEVASREIGHIAVFPANWRHQVTRVTRGRRAALVLWGTAPA